MQSTDSNILINPAYLQACQTRALWLDDDVVGQYRQQALQYFQSHGLPTRSDERWKYARLTDLAKQRFTAPQQPEAWSELPCATLPGAVSLCVIDGQLHMSVSDRKRLPQGVEVTSLSDLSCEQLAYYQQQLASLADTKQSFMQMNMALCHTGFLLQVKAGVHCDVPIEIVHYQTAQQQPLHHHVHQLVCLEDGASATVFERFYSAPDLSYFNNVLTQLDLCHSANLTYYKLQGESEQSHHIANTVVTQQQKSEFSGVLLAQGGVYSRDQIEWQFKGRDAISHFKSVLVAKQAQQIELYTQVSHTTSHCRSDQDIRTVLSDRANVTCHNDIYVTAGSSHTDAQLQNRNLLLSDQAKINTKPALEIYHDDVKCSHGATIGCLDEQAMFYLQSRGLSDAQAKSLLLNAFYSQIIDGVAPEEIRQLMQSSVGQFSVEQGGEHE